MKKILSLFLLASLFISCSSHDSNIVSYDEAETIKNAIAARERDTLWVKELESHILSENISQVSEVSTSIRLNPQIMALTSNQKEALYPDLENFANLDVYKMDEKVFANAQKFCKNLCANINKVPEKIFNSAYIFNYVFFKSDLYENWQTMFGEELKFSLDDFTGNSKNIKLFDEYIIGKGVVNEFYTSVPVRLKCEKGYLYLDLYFENENYLLNEVTIKGSEVL